MRNDLELTYGTDETNGHRQLAFPEGTKASQDLSVTRAEQTAFLTIKTRQIFQISVVVVVN
jgi:hypothetical protein